MITGPHRSGRTTRLIERALQWCAEGPTAIISTSVAASASLERRILTLHGTVPATLHLLTRSPDNARVSILFDDYSNRPDADAPGASTLPDADIGRRLFVTAAPTDENIAAALAAVSGGALQATHLELSHGSLEGEAVVATVNSIRASHSLSYRELCVIGTPERLRSVQAAARRHGVPTSASPTLTRSMYRSPAARAVEALTEMIATTTITSDTMRAVQTAGWAKALASQNHGTASPSEQNTVAAGVRPHPAAVPLVDTLRSLRSLDDLRHRLAPLTASDAAVHRDVHAALISSTNTGLTNTGLTNGGWSGEDGSETLWSEHAGLALRLPSEVVGCRWPVVLVVGAVEGRWSDDQFALAISRADRLAVATSAPRPGELALHHVEPWTSEAFVPGPIAAPTAMPPLSETVGPQPIWPGRSMRISASQVDTYRNCALQHVIEYGLRVRSEGGVQANFGTWVHELFEVFLNPASETPRTLEELHRLVDERWDEEIFDYRPQAVDYRRRLDGWLERWWTNEGRHLGEVVAVEHRFELPLGDHLVTGFIDRVNRTADGSLEIVDYKTGRKPGERALPSVQLATYLFAARTDPALTQLGDVSRLRLHYLSEESNPDVEIPLGADTEKQIGQLLLEVAEQIRDTTPVPSVDADCEYCDAKRLCPLQPEGRQVAVTVTEPVTPAARKRRGST